MHKEILEHIKSNLIATKQLDPAGTEYPDYGLTVFMELVFDRGIAQGAFLTGAISKDERDLLIYEINNFDMTQEYY